MSIRSEVPEELSWPEALAILSGWVAGFDVIRHPKTLSFDTVATVMAAKPGGMKPVSDADFDYDGHFIEEVMGRFDKPASQLLVIPDCGNIDLLPSIVPASLARKFIGDYEDPDTNWGLLDGAADVLFAFDTGELILVDHDERVWESSASD